MTILYLEVESYQTPKKSGDVCGDVVQVLRQCDATTVILADGLKSGIKARLSALFTVERLCTKLECGSSLSQAMSDILTTLEENRRQLSMWTALTVVRMLPRGQCTILTYEMPPPLSVARRHVNMIRSHSINFGACVVSQYEVDLGENEGLLLVSDGITEAGIGNGLALGWGIEGVRRDAELFITLDAIRNLPRLLVSRASELSGGSQTDDASAVLLLARRSRRVIVFTGPPLSPDRDAEVVGRFLDSEGCKIVCGGTTAGIVARYLGTEAIVDPKSLHPYCPPRYILEGVDYATEGVITLNQLYNLLDASPRVLEERNVVTELYETLCAADVIEFIVGTSENPEGSSQPFLQQGVLGRRQIVPLLAEKLRSQGKLVTIEWC